MNVYELEKRATPSPWIVWTGEDAYELHGDSGVVAHTYGLREDFMLTAHCRNNFIRALEALKNLVARNLIKDTDGDHMDEVLETIAAMEEVK